MYAGRVVEHGSKRDVFYDAQHPYAWGLLGSIARLDKPKPPRLTTIPGQPPSLLALPPGCHFAPRCSQRFDRCTVEDPPLAANVSPEHLDACLLSTEDKRSRRESVINPELAETGA